MIDFDHLAAKIREKLDDERLALRPAAKQIGVAYATLHRLSNPPTEHTPDLNSLARVMAWLDMRLSDFEPVRINERRTIADVTSAIAQLQDLSVASQDVMIKTVRTMHASLRERS